MDNLKYYSDSFAYDYEIFAPAKKKAEIHDYPGENTNKSTKKKTRAALRGRTLMVRNLVISALVVAAVCASLFLRAEISSMSNKINSLNKEITELESESVRLSVEMERRVSVTNLEEAAKALGMQKCEKSQVTYIQTNNADTAENSNGELTANLE